MSQKIKWLILVPTQLERERLNIKDDQGVCIELCGFGPVVAAANAARLIAKHAPERVLLCGISGALSDDVQTGAAYQFKRVALFGVGVGHGSDHVSAEQLGWKQWDQDGIIIASELTLDITNSSLDTKNSLAENTRDLLVSCCAASSEPADAVFVRNTFPDGKAEEMEGFAVATATKLASVPCHIVRGISNVAGDRNLANWKITEAMNSASRLVSQITGQC